ncbi:MAG: hypothetical protein ABI433_07010 [Burkholderiaceae bacterium]
MIEDTVTIGGLGPVSYRDFLLPCCSACNSRLLGPIERRIKRALESSQLGGLPPPQLAAWACKIILGTQFYERAGRDDTTEDSGGEKASRDYLAGLRGKRIVHHRNHAGFPFSILWLKTKLRADPKRNFDFRVNPYGQSLFLRLGNYSLLARPDYGYISRYGRDFFSRYVHHEHAPLQVEELAAHFFAMADCSLGDHARRQVAPSSVDGVTVLESIDLGHRVLFTVEVHERFRYWFVTLTEATEEDLFDLPGGGRRTFFGAEGSFVEIDAEAGCH